MARGRHIKRARSAVVVVAIAVGIVLVALGGVSYAAYRYDRASSDRILPGVTVAGTDVGGMTRVEAIQAVQRAAQERLAEPLTVRAGSGSWNSSPAELGRSADVGAAVDQAVQASESVGFITRVWHRLREQPVDISVGLTFEGGTTGVAALVSSIADDVAQTPRDASVAVIDGEVTFVHSRPGHALGTNVATKRLQAALVEGTAAVRLPVKTVKPKIPDAKIGKTIVVDRTINQLSLYNGFDLQKTYPVATAAAGYVTPPGQWTIIDKRENPTWTNPAPDTWGADLPASIPPGPGNPLGTRALYLDASGIRIHGTYDVGSIGTHASHGCIRMLMADVEQIYPLVPIGTRVIVF
ncbi:MAG: L,D-transpeptidase family protein [Actinomycetota bacterium]